MNPKVVRSGDTFAMPVPGTNIVFVFDESMDRLRPFMEHDETVTVADALAQVAGSAA